MLAFIKRHLRRDTPNPTTVDAVPSEPEKQTELKLTPATDNSQPGPTTDAYLSWMNALSEEDAAQALTHLKELVPNMDQPLTINTVLPVEKATTHSGLVCPNCAAPYTVEEEGDLNGQWWTACSHCGHKANDVHKVHAIIHPNSAHLLNPENITTQTWWHITDRDDWHTTIPQNPNLLLHLGDKEAALIRGNERHNIDNITTMYLYEVELIGTPAVSPILYRDMNEHWDTDKSQATYINADITRYLNRYEGAGTISIITTSQHLRIIQKRHLVSNKWELVDKGELPLLTRPEHTMC